MIVEPEYQIGQVADFFELTVQWVRWAESKKWFRRGDGTLIIPRRNNPPNAVAGYRKYTLTDIREMAVSLYLHQHIARYKYDIVMEKIAMEWHRYQQEAS